MEEERVRILKMLQEGKITRDEAELLLEAVEEQIQAQQQEGDHPEEQSKTGWNFDINQIGSQIGRDFGKMLKDGINTLSTEISKGLDQFTTTIVDSTKHTRSVETVTPVLAVKNIGIENDSGTIKVIPSETENLVVKADIHVWNIAEKIALDFADTIKINTNKKDENLYIKASFPPEKILHKYRIDFVVAIPNEINLSVENKSGAVFVEGIKDQLVINTQSGAIEVKDSCCHTEVHSKTGNITLENIEDILTAETRSGKIIIKSCLLKQYRLNSSSGRIKAKLNLQADSDGVIKSIAGDIGLAFDSSCDVSIAAETSAGKIIADELSIERNKTIEKENELQGHIRDGEGKLYIKSIAGDILLKDLES